MTSRRVSFPAAPAPAQIPGLASLHERHRLHRQSTASSLETGSHLESTTPADASITEEIAEIKRYEDFATIDWVQDAAQEQLRRRMRRREAAGFFDKDGVMGWRRRLWESYDAATAWIVVSLVGVIIGLIAAALNIITEWVSDVKLGYCTSAWYLNKDFCCYGAEAGCDEWHQWSSLYIVNYFLYLVFALLLAFLAAYLVKAYAPYAAGSGISEIKCIIAGFVMKGFLGFATLVIKSLCLPLAIASGLSVGKEGPSVHYATCVGNVVSRLFSKYRLSASKTREIITASAGTGVAVAFGSPIGGVLFSLEEMASHFPLKTLWRSYFCALVATAVLAAVNPFRTGQLVMFSVKYDRDWHFFEIFFYIILGIFGGIYGAVMIKGHLTVQKLRKRYLGNYAVEETVILAGATALLCYPNMFLRIDMTEMMEMLFRECEADYDYEGICDANNRWRILTSLFIATVLRMGLVVLSYGCRVPAGIFVPSMAIGASFGRMVGIFVQTLHETFPDSAFFSACAPDGPCITPGTYAFLGAGAALSGIMHLTVSIVVIMFELTGALTYILPTMIVVGVTKAVGSYFSKAGIAERMIWFNGYPFLDNKEEHNFGVPTSHAMTSNVTLVTSKGMTVQELQKLLNETSYTGFPIVEDVQDKILMGYIGRTELQYAINRAKNQGMLSPHAKVSFVPERAARDDQTPLTPAPPVTFESMSAQTVDFSTYCDSTPVTVHPRLPLDTAMELFKKMGPRVILVEHHGRFVGLVTVKDCLKYQFKAEALEHAASHGNGNGHGSGNLDAGDPQASHGHGHGHERIPELFFQGLSDWVSDWVNNLSRGKLRLLSPRIGGPPSGSSRRPGPGSGSGSGLNAHHNYGYADDYRNEHDILDGTEDGEEEEEEQEQEEAEVANEPGSVRLTVR